MEILTAAAMRRVDERAIRAHGIPGLTLMETAGSGIAAALAEEIPGISERHVVIVCGKGNNGGDGLVAARHLKKLGVSPRAFLIARAGELAGDAAANLVRARDAGVAVEELNGEDLAHRLREALDPETIVVDALLGTGAVGGARGAIARAIDAINDSRATVVAIDIPSGVETDSGQLAGPTVGPIER
jgi:NAD(P)H-hydrate epimerase